MTTPRIATQCPPAPADALFTTGGRTTALAWALHDIRDGRDTRILAFRNQTVVDYNREIHAVLHGTDTPFAVGETVMMQEAHEARMDSAGDPLRAPKVSLFNSEELVVAAIEPSHHPKHEALPAWRLVLERDTGSRVQVWVPADAALHQRQVGELFGQAAALKAELLRQRDSGKDETRRQLIARAWGLRNDFANVRHVYAMTIHKSQGSTLYTAIVDLSDVERMRDDFAYNRALYVATTRAANHLAFVA
jgi:exodeoxyribonuclease-5